MFIQRSFLAILVGTALCLLGVAVWIGACRAEDRPEGFHVDGTSDMAVPTVLDALVEPPPGGTEHGGVDAGPQPETPAAPVEPEILARSAILVDAATGEILYAKDPDLAIPPASMTKLMTMHIALARIEDGRLGLDELVHIGQDAWAANFPAGSSLMFLEPGQKVTVRELLLGLAVSSGNDAAAALAVHVAGDLMEFVGMMNQEAAALDLDQLYFVDPAGLSSRNQVTAGQFAEFCRVYAQAHPWALREFHAAVSFAYPQAWNLAPGSSQEPIVQENRNLMLQRYPGVDGLKTGYISSSGYNLAVTASREGRRLVAVLMGGPGENHAQGGENLVHDGTLLLDYGFAK